MKRAATTRGQARRDAAVEACLELLAREGRGAFSMRRVASELGISLGNLQYHFPTEADLFGAVVTSVLERSLASVEARFGRERAEVDRAELVDHLLGLHKDPTLAVVFFELWALASRDDGAARREMVRFYERYLDIVMAELPGESARSRRGRALAILALLEGVAVLAAGFAGRLGDADWRAIRVAILRVAEPA